MTANNKSVKKNSTSRFRRLISLVDSHAGTVPDDLPQEYPEQGKVYSLGHDEEEYLDGKVETSKNNADINEDDIRSPDSIKGSTVPSVLSGNTAQSNAPAIDASGMPLPRRVDEMDIDATRVSLTTYGKSETHRLGTQRDVISFPGTLSPSPRQVGIDWRKGMGCILRLSIIIAFFLIGIIIIAGSFIFYQYNKIASTLPNVYELRQRAAQFETTRIMDRNGNLLYEIVDPTAGRRSYVPLDKISPYLIAATVATEDQDFYSHPGFDTFGIFRAFLQNYQSGGNIVSGASTITQQLSRALLFTPEERVEQTYQRKIREAILAAEVTRRYSKEEILELYLNENYYGNLAYGVEAAAQTYFHTSADKLTLAQAAFLAGLPQAPSVYDIHSNPDVTLNRMEQVLYLMYEQSQEQGCIYISNSPQGVCVDALDVANSFDEITS